MKQLFTLIFFSVISIISYSQNINFENKYTSEIVFIKDSNLKKLLLKIIKKDVLCQTKGLEWYLDIIDNDKILISKYAIENFIDTKGINNIYATTIDDNILFIVNSEYMNNIISKSKYSIDLSHCKGKENYSTVDYSFWAIQKKGNKYQIIKEKKYNCD